MILDAKIDDVPNKQVAIRTDQPPIVADSVEALARQIGVPADALEATLTAYNAACRPGTFKPLEVDGLATSGLLWPPKSNWARTIDRAPFHAYPIISSNVFTFGGLKVNGNGQVLASDGDPIDGLYAAGETVGLYYKTYTGSTSVLKGAVFGRLAGQHAGAKASPRIDD